MLAHVVRRRVVSGIVAFLASAAFAASASAQCSQPVSEDSEPTIKDCIYIARAVIADQPCGDCVCDTDGSGEVRIADALHCLRFVVGGNVELQCPPCASTTTTLPACASCNDVLMGFSEPEELCEQSQPLYDALVHCPCDQCEEDCGSVICGVSTTESIGISSQNIFSCWSCIRTECREEAIDCSED